MQKAVQQKWSLGEPKENGSKHGDEQQGKEVKKAQGEFQNVTKDWDKMFKQLQTTLFSKKVTGNDLMYYVSLLSSSLKNPYGFNAKIVH